MSIRKTVSKAICLAGLAVGALYTCVLSANTTVILNCSASCAGVTVGCCAESTGQCKYRPSTSESWAHGSVENGNCVVNGKVVGKMPPPKADPGQDK